MSVDFKCNSKGKGYRIRNGDVTTFEEQLLFLKRGSNHESDTKISVSTVETSENAETERSSSSSLGNKRKVDKKGKDDVFVSKIERAAKRIKNGSNSMQSEGETSAEESIFSNDLLLRTIFANLKIEDLKSCRPVNSLWNLEATKKILLKDDCLAAIKISGNKVIHDTDGYKPPTPFQDFETILKNSKHFPATCFTVNIDKLRSNVVNLFRENGHLVKSFGFVCDDSYYEAQSTTAEIFVLAALNFPNLEKLKLVQATEKPAHPIILMTMELVPEFKNLHTLELNCGFQANVVSQILKKASNLKNIHLHGDEDQEFELEYFDYLDKLMKLGDVIPRLKNIHLEISKYSMKIYQEVLKQKPKFCSIDKITLDDDEYMNSADGGRFLTQLFQECSESLTEISGIRCVNDVYISVFSIPGLPVLPKVKKLGIDVQSLSLPPSLNLTEVFPNLASIEVECSKNCPPQDSLVEALRPLLPVRHLKVKWERKIRYIPAFLVKALCSFCPNVTSAHFSNPLSDSAYEYIWKLSKLQDLHLEIGTKPRANLLSALDSAFTGFSVETVKNLYRMNPADWSLSAEEMESFRIKPSVVDLKELTRLSLRLFDATVNERERPAWDRDLTFVTKNAEVNFDPGNGKALLTVDGKIILSYITKRFGFDLCPRLNSNVSVGFTHYTQPNQVAK